MRVLAIDTATEVCSAALLINGALYTREQSLERGHAEHILGMVDALLAEGGVALGALDAIAFGRGPGAFTGVRLAASVTQGLAFGADLPVVAVSDLRALAQQALDADPGVAAVLACTDARMREVYWGWFGRDADGLAAPAGPEHVGDPLGVQPPQGWVRPAGRACGAGSGFTASPVLRERTAGVLDLVIGDMLPRAREVARLAVAEVAAGRVHPPESAIPTYLRDDVARAPAAASSD